jgi:putative tryptophan/tyrosine transport system substrate-binding protein
MDRRRFVATIGSVIAAPSLVMAQKPGKVHRIGWLSIAFRNDIVHFVAAFEQGLRDHGYIPGQNAVIEIRSADGKPERLPDLARELVRNNVDVIVVGTNPNTSAAKSVTPSIPIVFAIGTDVIRAGLVKSLANPGGNVTGLTWDVGGDIVAKRYELLKEIAPRISRVANLWEPPYKDQYLKPTDDAASVLRLSSSWFEFSGNLERDFAEMLRWRADGLVSHTAGRQFQQRAELCELAVKHRLPSAFPISEFVDAGGLMSYGPNAAAAFRSAARYVGKILKGAKPADLPVEQPTKIDLTINLKTAKALGLKIPPSILLRADRVIE